MIRKSRFFFCAPSTSSATSPPPTQAPNPPRISLKKSRPPVTDDQVKELFSGKQRATWPSNYRPSVGASAFLRKEGVPLSALIELRKEITEDHNADLQKDLAYDMSLWTRCTFEKEMLSCDDRRRRLVKRVLSRDRVPTYSEVVSFAKVPSLAEGKYDKECRDLPGHNENPQDTITTAGGASSSANNQLKLAQEARKKLLEREQLIRDGKRYPFTPQAQLQTKKVFSVLESSGIQALSDRVVFPDFPSFSNLLHHHYDSCQFLRFIAARTGDELLINQELVRELSLYLRKRMEYYHGSERIAQEEKILREKNNNHNKTVKINTETTPCILFMFSNGRLPQAIRDTQILLPSNFSVVGTNTRKRIIKKDSALPVLGEADTPASYGQEFPYDVLPVRQALEKYRPTIIVAEPHCDRDWTAEMRGFPTVREVVVLGQVDSPATCSFSYPWLSFGCAPSAETYFVYNSLFQRLNVNADTQFMPMDAPYLQQGYEKLYLDDDVSKWMVCANDHAEAPHQSRCCVFRRLLEKL